MRDVNLVLKGLISQFVIPKPGYMKVGGRNPWRYLANPRSPAISR